MEELGSTACLKIFVGGVDELVQLSHFDVSLPLDFLILAVDIVNGKLKFSAIVDVWVSLVWVQVAYLLRCHLYSKSVSDGSLLRDHACHGFCTPAIADTSVDSCPVGKRAAVGAFAQFYLWGANSL